MHPPTPTRESTTVYCFGHDGERRANGGSVVEFRILGAVEAWAGGKRGDLGSRKQRLVLAVLLLESNQLVPLDRLVDRVWSERTRASARASVQTLVSRLRAAFRQVDDGPSFPMKNSAA
ncbi:winged helix-turn-helix domain-containing protein [Micromonospora sp. NPDC005173]|uniref:AfsR/SARP family transcriptional regulator n=1 Tax=Micromonospora sp. NPDC005173 TaxID=3157165 RepID=UPI0033BF5654